MKESGSYILENFRKRWQFLLFVEIALYAIGPAVLLFFLGINLLFSFLAFFIIAIALTAFIRPWSLTLKYISSFIDQNLNVTEYSTGLLLVPKERLSSLAQLQQYKVAIQLKDQIRNVKPQNNLLRAVLVATTFLIIGLLVNQFMSADYFKAPISSKDQESKMVFKPTDSASIEIEAPVLKDQLVTISYPAYTNIPSFSTSKKDVKALEGSRISWRVQFDKAVDSVAMENAGKVHLLELNKDSYTRSIILNNSGFYNFKFQDTLGGTYVSEIYPLKVLKDQNPVIEMKGLEDFTTFDFNEPKKLGFKTLITDDFGLAEASIIATVSKGSGESVKFREEKLSFDNPVKTGSKSLNLSKNINLDSLNMEPGDELYFYVETSDLKQPVPNKTRSETYFAVIRDTTSYDFAVEGTMGVDLMPAYFRSQRQLIIDTKKLISEKSKIPIKSFNTRSNALGFDQKALRLKYGEFMGDEAEGSIGNTEEMPALEHNVEDSDPLAEYRHNHDSANEHNLVEQSGAEGHTDEAENDPLHDYLHNHDDPEESTLFTQSLKSKLRQALNEMWDAELHLRLYEPQKSLPFQNRALKLLQEIKNSARIYVHRIGFDPPPIKEDKRLTGDIEKVSNFRKTEELEKQMDYPNMRQAVLRLEQLISSKQNILKEDRALFEDAGNELSEIAIAEPGNYLETLQQLKWLAEVNQYQPEALQSVQKGLLSAIPQAMPDPTKRNGSIGELNELLLEQLQENDR